MKITTTYSQQRWIALFFWVCLLAGSACNKDFQNKIEDRSSNDTLGIGAKVPKILYLDVDGVRGDVLRALNAPNISKIVKNAVYTYSGLSDFESNEMTNAASWANMLTGVTGKKHGITTDDFSENQLSAYPSIFSRLKEVNPSLRTVSFAASVAVNTYLAKDATISRTFENDDASVKNAVINELQNEDASLVFAQFHGVDLAGQENGYEQTSQTYTGAILSVDQYIGEIMAALNSRKGFSNENWLVIIASNKGGEATPDPDITDFTAYGDATRNNFIIFYNPRFSTLFAAKPASDNIPYVSSSIYYDYSASKRPVARINNADEYDFGSEGDYTVELLVKIEAGNPYYPVFISKRENAFTGPGWQLHMEYNFDGPYCKWTFNSSASSQAAGGAIGDGQWHKLSVVLDRGAGKVRLYTDGHMDDEKDLSGSLSSDFPLKLGYLQGDGNESARIMMNSLQIYDKALSTNDIEDRSCKTVADESDPNYTSLIGYWPMNEGQGTTLSEKTGKGSPLRLGSNSSWENVEDITPTLCPEISDSFYKLVPNDADIPFQIYLWMGIVPSPSWGLDGKSWIPVYSDIKP